jgi:hypothetical protein
MNRRRLTRDQVTVIRGLLAGLSAEIDHLTRRVEAAEAAADLPVTAAA